MSNEADEQYVDEDHLLPVAYARNQAEADDLRQLLEDHDLPVEVADVDELLDSDSNDAEKGEGLAILVPAEFAADAEEVLAERDCVTEEMHEHLGDLDDLDDDDEVDDFEDGFEPEHDESDFVFSNDSDDDDVYANDDDEETLY